MSAKPLKYFHLKLVKLIVELQLGSYGYILNFHKDTIFITFLQNFYFPTLFTVKLCLFDVLKIPSQPRVKFKIEI